MAPPANALDLVTARVSPANALDVGAFTIKVAGTKKYIGRADADLKFDKPQPIVVLNKPYTWLVSPLGVTSKPPFHYNLIAGTSNAGRWTAKGKKVYSFVTPVKGEDAATDLQILPIGGSQKTGYKYYIKQSNLSVAGQPKSGAWYVHKPDKFAPVFAGTKGKATAFQFEIEDVSRIKGSAGSARSEDEHLGPVHVDIL
ncbi:hypothetical protein OC844_000958 [Tilletia horrida]|nr:hypothetical protein OC844_000958 [Tilletia horrida]